MNSNHKKQTKFIQFPKTKIYTSTEVARLLGCAPRTVAKWCEMGLFPCHYRLPPASEDPMRGTGDRRFTRDSILEFCRTRNIPVPQSLSCDVLAITDASSAQAIALAVPHLYVLWANDPFQAGRICEAMWPRIVFINFNYLGTSVATALGASIRECVPGPDISLVALLPEDMGSETEHKEWSRTLVSPVSLETIARALTEAHNLRHGR